MSSKGQSPVSILASILIFLHYANQILAQALSITEMIPSSEAVTSSSTEFVRPALFLIRCCSAIVCFRSAFGEYVDLHKTIHLELSARLSFGQRFTFLGGEAT
jgi:hypothetical protein